MTDEQVCETVEKYGANREECARLNASLTCLRNVHMSGEQALGTEAPPQHDVLGSSRFLRLSCRPG